MQRPSFLPRIDAQPVADREAGLWAIDGDRLIAIERFDVGPAMVLVPGEDVLLLAVDLPIANARRRSEAAPFAIEDRIAAPLADVHVALGVELAAGRYLAGIAGRDRMSAWTAMLGEAGLERAALVPDPLWLPVPVADSWNVAATADRALVRVSDGTGFALPLAHLAAAWAAAGRPAIASYDEPLDPAFGATPAIDGAGAAFARLAAPPIDLRQGVYAAPRGAVSPLWRRIAVVAAAGALAHGAIAGADTLALSHIAANREAETRALVVQAAPGAALGDDLATDVANLLPESSTGPSAFLPLVGRISGALKTLGPGVRLRDLSYDGAARTMSVDVEAPSLAAIQSVAPAFASAGLSFQPGAASESDGKAIGAFLIRTGA